MSNAFPSPPPSPNSREAENLRVRLALNRHPPPPHETYQRVLDLQSIDRSGFDLDQETAYQEDFRTAWRLSMEYSARLREENERGWAEYRRDREEDDRRELAEAAGNPAALRRIAQRKKENETRRIEILEVIRLERERIKEREREKNEATSSTWTESGLETGMRAVQLEG